MTDDITLLREYAQKRSQAAFTELVQRRVGLVYATALPHVGGDAHLAQDVTQKVFIELARNATALLNRPTLGGWLYRVAHYTAVDLVRSERRRRVREQRSELMPDESNLSAATSWDKLWPVIDEAMRALKESDRDAIALRFFENRAFADIGRALWVSEEAARKRVERALEQMAGALARRGITSTSAAVATALAEKALCAAPAGLASSVSGLALASAAAAKGGSIFAGLSSLKMAAVFGVAAVLTAVVGFRELARTSDDPPVPAKREPATDSRTTRARADQPVILTESGAASASAPVAVTPVPVMAATTASPLNSNVLVVNLPYLYDNSARTKAFNATIQAKDRLAQTEVDQMNAQGNALVAEYRNLPPESDAAKAVMERIEAQQKRIQIYIADTRASLQAELKAYRDSEVARITALVEAYRVEHGFAIAYDSNRQANVGMALLPAGIEGVDGTDAMFARIDR